jgi:hypothetical protein
MFSIMSMMQRAGSWLEGTAAIPFDGGPKPRLLDRFRQEIYALSQDFRQASFQGDKPEQADPGLGIQLCDKVDVAVRPSLVTRERAEQTEVSNAGLLQLRRVRAQGGDDGVR